MRSGRSPVESRQNRAVSEAYRAVDRCRICRSSTLERFLNLGIMPLANALVDPAHADDPEARFPLDVIRCLACGLIQLGEVVRPELMFTNYPYSSSASAPLALHFARLADQLVERFAPRGSLVVEIGSNDGVLLRPLVERGIHAVGVEPAKNLADVSRKAGFETWNEYFSPDVARRIVATRGHAHVVVGTNVLAHIDDLHGVLTGVDALLGDRGVLVAEVPYLGDLIERVEYDTIYHEHLSYFSIGPLVDLFDRFDVELIGLDHLAIHGGSLRLFVGRRGVRAVSDSVGRTRESEAARGLDDPTTYRSFARNVERSRTELIDLLGGLRAQGKRIAGHGASAKGSTLLNYCGIGTETLEFIADGTPFKHGKLSPGTHVPIRDETAILDEVPDFTLLLAWNYADSVVPRFAAYTTAGGRFIHPIPYARVLP